MYLTERLIGVGVYTTLMLATMYVTARSQRRFMGLMLTIYLLLISIMAFLYVPAVEADLYRLLEYMDDYASMSWPEFQSLLISSTTPVTALYYRIIGSMGAPGLLAGITTLLVFTNIFYIVYDYFVRNKATQGSVSVAIMAIMSSGVYMQTVGNIRTMLAFSIIARCFYSETQNKKSFYRNITWYLIACLIHPAAIVALTIRIGALLWNKLTSRQIRSLVVLLLVTTAGLYAVSIFGVEAINNVIEKADEYTNEIGYTYIWDNVISLIIIGFITIQYGLYRLRKVPDLAMRSLIQFSFILILFALTFFFEHATFVRFTQLNLFIVIPLVISNCSAYSKGLIPDYHLKKYRILVRASLSLLALMLVVSVTRGALSSLKFFIM